MLVSSFSPKKMRVGIAAIGILATSLILAACSKSNAPATSTTGANNPPQGVEETGGATANNPPAASPNPAGQTQAPISPVVKASTTDQAVTNEGAQLNQLNTNAGSIDKSLNDKPIDVNQ
jgi:hypothetical protein